MPRPKPSSSPCEFFLTMQGNSFHCNASLIWLTKTKQIILNSSKMMYRVDVPQQRSVCIVDAPQVVCTAPPRLENRTIFDMNPQELDASLEGTKPKLDGKESQLGAIESRLNGTESKFEGTDIVNSARCIPCTQFFIWIPISVMSCHRYDLNFLML